MLTQVLNELNSEIQKLSVCVLVCVGVCVWSSISIVALFVNKCCKNIDEKMTITKTTIKIRTNSLEKKNKTTETNNIKKQWIKLNVSRKAMKRNKTDCQRSS